MQRFIDCLKLLLNQKQFCELHYDLDGLVKVLKDSVEFFETGVLPDDLESLKFLNRFLEVHLEMPHDDLLCKLWNEIGTNLHLGQITTPMIICDYMNGQVLPMTFKKFKEEERPYIFILDPACGSGIFAVSAYNQFRGYPEWDKCVFHQIDIDLRCCYMTILNLLIRNFNAVVWNADAFALMSGEYQIEHGNPLQGWILKSGKKISDLYKMTKEESYDCFKRIFGTEDQQREKMQHVKTTAAGVEDVDNSTGKQMQLC